MSGSTDSVVCLAYSSVGIRCTKVLKHYRSCGLKGCSWELGFCEDHGGDGEAVRAIQTHMRIVHNHG